MELNKVLRRGAGIIQHIYIYWILYFYKGDNNLVKNKS